MANNKLQIYCKKCMQFSVLAKYYPVSWDGFFVKNYEEFVIDHQKKCFDDAWAREEKVEADLGFGTGMFGFRTEMDEDGLCSDYHETPCKLIPMPGEAL